MHILLEGVCHLELSNMLNYAINEKKYFDIDQLNYKIRNEIKTNLTDKPHAIDKEEIKKKKFTQSAGQMLNLLLNLPHLIGDSFTDTDSNWNNFLNLYQIINICFTYSYTNDNFNDFNFLVANYLKCFKNLYTSITPKMHFLTHLPQQMKNFGPLRQHACLRLEGKHRDIKTMKYKNFINICYSIAHRLQLHNLVNQYDSGFDEKTKYIKKKDIIINHSYLCNKNDENWINLKPNFELILCDEIIINGLIYKIQDFIILNVNYKNGIQNTGKILKIFLKDKDVVFLVENCITKFKDKKKCILACEPTGNKSYVYFKSLKHKHPQPLIFHDHNIFFIKPTFFSHSLFS